jgi:hypothetical protein
MRDAIQVHERRSADIPSSFVRVKDLVDLGYARLDGGNVLVPLSVGGSDTGGIDPGSVNLDDLADVTITSPATGQVLTWDGAVWVNQAVTGSLTDDPYFNSYVELLLGFEGANAATSTTDASTAQRVLTFQGNAQISTTQFKFGASSLKLDGTGDYITTPNRALFEPTSRRMTVECWARPDINNAVKCIASCRPSSGDGGWEMAISATGKATFSVIGTGVSAVALVGTTTLSVSTWYHIAASQNDDFWYLFVNGTLEASARQSNAPVAGAGLMHVGRSPGFTARDFQGYVDEFRYTSDICRYAASFTAPTTAFSRTQRA